MLYSEKEKKKICRKLDRLIKRFNLNSKAVNLIGLKELSKYVK